MAKKYVPNITSVIDKTKTVVPKYRELRDHEFNGAMIENVLERSKRLRREASEASTIKDNRSGINQLLLNAAGNWENNKPQLMRDFPITDFAIGPTLDYVSGRSDVTPMLAGGVGNLNVSQALKMPNVYKVNPWAFKPKTGAYYHRSPNIENIINRETGTLQGFGQSEAGKIFSLDAGPGRGPGGRGKINLKKEANSDLYFSKDVPLDYGRYNDPSKIRGYNSAGEPIMYSGQGYRGPYLAEVENVPMLSSSQGRTKSIAPTRPESYAVSAEPIPVGNVNFYKEDWIRGYKPINIKKDGGQLNNNNNMDTEYKSGGWIQDAVNPKHKGYCTPMTKSTCTPRRKAFALREIFPVLTSLIPEISPAFCLFTKLFLL